MVKTVAYGSFYNKKPVAPISVGKYILCIMFPRLGSFEPRLFCKMKTTGTAGGYDCRFGSYCFFAEWRATFWSYAALPSSVSQ